MYNLSTANIKSVDMHMGMRRTSAPLLIENANSRSFHESAHMSMNVYCEGVTPTFVHLACIRKNIKGLPNNYTEGSRGATIK